jgi:hypothetical protein
LPSGNALEQLGFAVDRVQDFFPILDLGFGDSMVTAAATENHDASRHDVSPH